MLCQEIWQLHYTESVRAAILDFRQRRLASAEIPEPAITSPDEVLMRVEAVGICGTDRELANFRFGYPPDGSDYLVLGHEAVGQVIEVGSAVTGIQPGDWVAPLIRRGCVPPCRSCGQNRRDLCLTGGYKERGIFGAHGYFSGFAVDSSADLVLIPPDRADIGVLLEPLSVVEKAVAMALELHRGEARTANVVGAGTIGILAGLVLNACGFTVTVCSLEAADSARATLVRRAGLRYVTALAEKADIVIEAAGSPEGAAHGLASLAPLGVMVVLGAAETARFPLLQLIVQNQIIAGSVNTSPEAAARAALRLAELDPEVPRAMITRAKFEDFEQSILGPQVGAPKTVHMMQS
jgi:threonine dehydrogenase-like Zn-dependent dehydrogenase